MISILNELTLQNCIAKNMLKMHYVQKLKTQQQQNQTANIEIFAKAGIRTQELLQSRVLHLGHRFN